MKKVIVSLVAITTILFSAEAQTRRTDAKAMQDSAGNQTESQYKKSKNQRKSDLKEMADKLDLTTAQKKEMKAINGDFKNKMNELKTSNLSAEELTAKKAALHQERKQKTDALFTAEQKSKMNELKKERAGKGEMGSAKRMGKIQEKLALSDDQVQKLNAQKDAYKVKEDAVKTNPSLSADQKAAQMKALRAEKKSSFKSILTADQLKTMQEMKQKRAPKAA